MQSTINWKSSVPTHGGRYLVVLNNGRITCDHFSYDSFTGKMSWCVYSMTKSSIGVELKVLS